MNCRLLLITLITPVLLHAQSEKTVKAPEDNSLRLRLPTKVGNYMVGANVFLANIQFRKDVDATYDVGLNPKIGYFILPNIALGATFNVGVQGTRNYNAFIYGATPFARVYFAHNNEGQPDRPLQFFIEGGAGYGGSVSHYERINNGVATTETEHSNGFRAYLLPGVDYFINRHIAVEAGLQYTYNAGRYKVNTLGLNLGFQIFLGR